MGRHVRHLEVSYSRYDHGFGFSSRTSRGAGEGPTLRASRGRVAMPVNTGELQSRLARESGAPDEDTPFESLAADLLEDGISISDVRTILRFMAEHPAVDFGSPGPLVHVVERLYGAGYEAELCAVIARRPTAHTVWMLHRVLNGTKDAALRESYVDALRAVATHPLADRDAKMCAASFVERLEG